MIKTDTGIKIGKKRETVTRTVIKRKIVTKNGIEKRRKIDTRMTKNPVQRIKIETIRTRNISQVLGIRIGEIKIRKGTGKRIRKGTGKRIKRGTGKRIRREIGIKISTNIVPRISTVVPKISIGIRKEIKTDIPAPRIRIRRKRNLKKKVTYFLEFYYVNLGFLLLI